ncbi:MAG: hypothetical protein FWG61_08745 [Firmicutes bacterium]|nr:hypothetical protein [Bacillota bacterium]
MTDKQKQAIREMRRVGLTYSEIANATGLPPNTVKSFCHRYNICVIGASGDEGRTVCRQCGKLLEHYPGKKKKQFCSDNCRTNWWNRNRQWLHRKKVHHLLCHCCGAVFESYGNKQQKYCGRDCYIRSRYGEGLP